MRAWYSVLRTIYSMSISILWTSLWDWLSWLCNIPPEISCSPLWQLACQYPIWCYLWMQSFDLYCVYCCESPHVIWHYQLENVLVFIRFTHYWNYRFMQQRPEFFVFIMFEISIQWCRYDCSCGTLLVKNDFAVSSHHTFVILQSLLLSMT
jgi:hypothetical protein